MSKHDKFILMPMNTILKDAILATSGIGNGIETYPLCDYIIQSIFLSFLLNLYTFFRTLFYL